MAFTGSLPMVTTQDTWSENLEVWDVDSDELADLTDMTEITLRLRGMMSHVDELTLTMTGGDIVLPSTGIVQWRAEQSVMAGIEPSVYKVIMTFTDGTDTMSLLLGSVSVVE